MEYQQIGIKKSLSGFIRCMMLLGSVIRLGSIAEFILSIVFLMLYLYKYVDLTEEEKKTIYCPSCMVNFTMSSIYVGIVWIFDAAFLSNAIGAYIRQHYGAGVEDSDDRNFEALCDIDADGSSISAKCMGCGCCKSVGIVYQKYYKKTMIRSEDSQCQTCGNYMCFAIYPFNHIRKLIKKFGYAGAVSITFVVTLVVFLGSTASTIYGILCVTNDITCSPPRILSSSLSSSSSSSHTSSFKAIF